MNKKHYNQIIEHYILPVEDKTEKKILSDYIDLADSEIPEILFWEKKMVIEIECWRYLIQVSWIIDCYHLDWFISDLKTSKSKWEEWRENTLLQPRIYSYMFRSKKWETKWTKEFKYYILSKHKRDKCKLDVRTVYIDLEEAKQKILDSVKEYIVAYHAKTYEARQNKYCFWCPLYRNHTCKVHNPDINEDEII